MFLVSGGAALMLFFVALIVSIFATVDYDDAIIEAKWVSARGLYDPTPGSLFVLTKDGLHGRPICRLNLSGRLLVGRGRTRKYVFTNVLGDVMPFLAELNVFLFRQDTEKSPKIISRSFDLVWVADELYVRSFKGVPMEKECEKDFHDALNGGDTICTVDRAIVAPGEDSTVYAVGFRHACASKCPVGKKDCTFPEFTSTYSFSWTSMLKNEIGLVRLDRKPMPK